MTQLIKVFVSVSVLSKHLPTQCTIHFGNIADNCRIYSITKYKRGELLTGETPFHRLRNFSVLTTLMKTVNIPTFGALQKDVRGTITDTLEVVNGQNNSPYILHQSIYLQKYE